MFSIIVPIYKVEKFLTQCIDSILAQTYSDFELILVDDGSPDNCPRICDEYAEKDSRIIVIHKKNSGLMSTRKAGIAVAGGDYICFVDGDDFVEKNMLETYHNILSKREIDVISCGYSTYCDGKITTIQQKIPAGFYDKENLLNNVYPQMLSCEPFFSFYIVPSVSTKCFKKDILKKIYANIPDEISLGEDVAASYPMLLCADAVAVINYYGYIYRQNQNSMTHTYDRNLHKKIKSLVLYLRDCNRVYQWNGIEQIDKYAVYLIYLAKNNELIYNRQDTYCVKKKNFKKFLNDEVFSPVIKKVRVRGFKNKFILWCFKTRVVLPLYLLSKKK